MSTNSYLDPPTFRQVESEENKEDLYFRSSRSFQRASSYLSHEGTRIHANMADDDENKRLMEAIFGDQFRHYNLNEQAFADFGYTIPQSVREAGISDVIEQETSQENRELLADLYGYQFDDDLFGIAVHNDQLDTSVERSEFANLSPSESMVLPECLGDTIDPRPEVDDQYITTIDSYGRTIIDLITPTTTKSIIDLITPVIARPIIPSMEAEICEAEAPHLVSDNGSDSGASPGTGHGYDASPVTLHYFNQAAVHVTTRELVDDFVAAQATNLAGSILDIDPYAEAEKAETNNTFFNLNNTPGAFNPTSPYIFGATPRFGSIDSYSPITDDGHLLPSVGEEVQIDDLADPDYYLGPNVPFPDDDLLLQKVTEQRRISLTPSYKTITSRKRCADNLNDDNLDEITVKKARTCSTRSSSSIKGFAGQFAMLIPPFTTSQINDFSEPITFGDPRNANGRITNPQFFKDPYFHTLDWEGETKDDADLQAMLAHARVKTQIAEEMGRTGMEEAQRRLCHLECTEARLTGRAVGFYRYEEGHMTVEEYVEAGLCVCWEGCWCSKLCTRFGDVLCPCAKLLILDA